MTTVEQPPGLVQQTLFTRPPTAERRRRTPPQVRDQVADLDEATLERRLRTLPRLVEPAPIRDPALDQPADPRRCLDDDCGEVLGPDDPICRWCGANQLQLATRQITADLAYLAAVHGRALPPIHIDLRSPR